MPDLFAGPAPEEIQKRKIENIGILLENAQEDLERAATIVPGKLPLEKVEEIKKSLMDIAALVENLKIILQENRVEQ